MYVKTLRDCKCYENRIVVNILTACVPSRWESEVPQGRSQSEAQPLVSPVTPSTGPLLSLQTLFPSSHGFAVPLQAARAQCARCSAYRFSPGTCAPGPRFWASSEIVQFAWGNCLTPLGTCFLPCEGCGHNTSVFAQRVLISSSGPCEVKQVVRGKKKRKRLCSQGRSYTLFFGP